MTKSFKFAIQGIRDAIKSEPNLSVHLLFGLVAIILGYFMKLTNPEMAILLLTIFVVIILEMVNTAIEKIVDLHSLKKSELARQIKDISAGVVFLASILAIIVGSFLFLPKLFA